MVVPNTVQKSEKDKPNLPFKHGREPKIDNDIDFNYDVKRKTSVVPSTSSNRDKPSTSLSSKTSKDLSSSRPRYKEAGSSKPSPKDNID